MAFHFFLQALFFLSGLLCLLAAAADWEWFFTTESSRSFYRFYTSVRRLCLRRRGKSVSHAAPSRRTLRLIYAVGGVLLMSLAVWFFWLTCRAFANTPPFF